MRKVEVIELGPFTALIKGVLKRPSIIVNEVNER